MKVVSESYRKAMKEGRKCARCGWMITKKNWAAGYRLCAGCFDAMKGVNTAPRWGMYLDEPIDKTGEML